MILKELQDFVLDYHRVSLADMELHFHVDGDALRQMLSKLIQKGRVRKVLTPEKCHGCTFCNPKMVEFYEWVDQQYSTSPNISKNNSIKAQIHGIKGLEEDFTATKQTGVKYAVILHDCEETKL